MFRLYSGESEKCMLQLCAKAKVIIYIKNICDISSTHVNEALFRYELTMVTYDTNIIHLPSRYCSYANVTLQSILTTSNSMPTRGQ